jgi:transcriptional regulator with XRE-family HTH domain
VAGRLGTALRDARRVAGHTQSQVADRASVSQPLISNLERGRGQTASIETWACVAAALGEQFVGFLEHAPGATPPRDIEHLRRQSALIGMAAAGGWVALPEFAIDPGASRSRSIDVALIRTASREAIAAEIWDWFDDVGASLRGLDAKVTMLGSRLAEGPTNIGHGTTDPARTRTHGDADTWRVGGLFIIRDTRRNRAIVAELRPLFAARFTGSSTAWLRALTSDDTSTPDGHGLLWSESPGRLIASRIADRRWVSGKRA